MSTQKGKGSGIVRKLPKVFRQSKRATYMVVLLFVVVIVAVLVFVKIVSAGSDNSFINCSFFANKVGSAYGGSWAGTKGSTAKWNEGGYIYQTYEFEVGANVNEKNSKVDHGVEVPPDTLDQQLTAPPTGKCTRFYAGPAGSINLKGTSGLIDLNNFKVGGVRPVDVRLGKPDLGAHNTYGEIAPPDHTLSPLIARLWAKNGTGAMTYGNGPSSTSNGTFAAFGDDGGKAWINGHNDGNTIWCQGIAGNKTYCNNIGDTPSCNSDGSGSCGGAGYMFVSDNCDNNMQDPTPSGTVSVNTCSANAQNWWDQVDANGVDSYQGLIGSAGGTLKDFRLYMEARSTHLNVIAAITVLTFKYKIPAGTVASFNLTPIATPASDDPSNENPSNAIFKSGISNVGAAVDGVQVTRTFTVTHGTTTYTVTPTSGPANGTSAPTIPANGTLNFTPDTTQALGLILPAGQKLQVGDTICAQETLHPGSGKVDVATQTITQYGPDATPPKNCIQIVNKPYTKFFGGDVFVGGNFGVPGCLPASPTANIETFNDGFGTPINSGSSAQFAAYVLGVIDNFTTANLGGGSAGPPTGLTFANTSPLGSFTNTVCVHDYWADDTSGLTATSTDYLDVSSLSANQRYMYTPAGGLKNSKNNQPWLDLYSSNGIANGRRIFLFVKGDVLIHAKPVGGVIPSQNITYQNTSWPTENDVPAFYLIVQGDIYIDHGATQLDGAYVAESPPGASTGGHIYTCTAAAGGPPTGATNPGFFYSGGLCSQAQLTVNGTFIAKDIKLLRTDNSLRNSIGGSAETLGSSNAAEIFNFSPELYIPDICESIPGLCSATTQDDAYTGLSPIL